LGKSNLIYLDSAASYPLLPEVLNELNRAFAQVYGNSTATHSAGIAASEIVEQVRKQVASVIGAYNSEIIFTSGATESNNIAFKSLLLNNPELELKRHIVTSSMEHKCILVICSHFESLGYEVTYVKPNKDGIITKDIIKQAIRPDTALVSVMHVNNEIGTINPVDEIGLMCFEKRILFHVDAAQSFLKVPIDVDDLNIDLMSFSAHKIGGPKGIGAIYIRDLRKRELTPVIHGAGQEEGLRGGTVASPLISGFGMAIDHFPSYFKLLQNMAPKTYLLDELAKAQIEFVTNGSIETSLPNICSITLATTDVSLLIRSNEDKFCLAQGSACSSKEIEPSHVLLSLGLLREQADKTLRISFSHRNTMRDIDAFIESFKNSGRV
jgi:cysteine desulfurase